MAAIAEMMSKAAFNLGDLMNVKQGTKNHSILVMAVVCFLSLLVPMDLVQLVFVLLGAIGFYVIQKLQKTVDGHAVKPKGKSKMFDMDSPISSDPRRSYKTSDFGASKPKRPRQIPGQSGAGQGQSKATPAQMSQLRPSTAPVLAPKFEAVNLEGQVEELLGQILPTAESDKAVNKLANAVKYLLSPVLPGIEVSGFASADLSRGKAFGVAVPDVDIVVNVDPDVLAQRVSSSKNAADWAGLHKIDAKKLQKSAVRLCTDRLVNAGSFKFRRSAFRGDEPKVTLLAPVDLGIFNEAVALDLSVNSVAPLHAAALMSACGQYDAHAKALMSLVRRWAKDRGICHQPKGFFSPYVWSVLTIYFLQVADGANILPPLEEIEAVASLMTGKKAGSPKTVGSQDRTAEAKAKKSVSKLFLDFMSFYASFDWGKEAVCPRLATRGAPGLKLPIHIIVNEDDGNTLAGPSVEDPFVQSLNLGTCMNGWSFKRIKEEFQRGEEILSKEEASLSELLEPWTPPVASAGETSPGGKE